ncbi:sigma-54 dependent transcriptional regulator [Methyloglobulus sp.]|uniref:sigma-54 dependent transcriptional regulator n=1 Tax=Methyloglobulus sp. TaxID=2518622 RepID=UPI0032B719A3
MPNETALTPLNSEWTVAIWEHQSPRLKNIRRVLSACGARTFLIDGLTAFDNLEFSHTCWLAIVALETCPTEDTLALNVIRRLKSLGFSVIAHEQGIDTWPLGVRSRVFLAGSARLLDSGKNDFAKDLQNLLMRMLRLNVSEQKEVKKIKGLMNSFGIVGESEAMLTIFRQVLKISPLSDLSVLITGGSGTGKELIARAIHRLDPKRRDGPFVAVNCGAICSGVAESELFGHKRGAFTGADRDRRGLICSADGGVLFLDEIGELSGDLQAKLLRVLQENRVLIVGDDQEVSVDFRIIAATNRDLEMEMEQREFRVDLFHRLNVLSIYLCPLRERVADIKPLVEHFLTKYRTLSPSVTLSVEQGFLDAVANLKFPGNARELENLVRRALVNKQDDTPLGLCDLPVEIWQQLCEQHECQTKSALCCDIQNVLDASQPSPLALNALFQWLDSNGWDLTHALEYCERLILESALHHAHGNQTDTANLLGITPRTIFNKLRKHHLGH